MTPLLLADALEIAAARADDGLALSHGRRSVTYGELDGYANALAFALERRGVLPGHRVATLLDGPEALIAFWAIAKAGAVGVPLAEEEAAELAAALREVDARALIVDAGVAPMFHHAVARAPALGVVIVRGRDADVDATGSAAYVSYEAALADEDPLSRPSLRRVDLDDAWLEHEGEGVRCALSHRVILSRASSLSRGIGIEQRDAVGGMAFADIAVACALAGACFRVLDDPPREGGRSFWICGDDDEEIPASAGTTTLTLYGSPACGPVALLMPNNEPARVLPNVDVRVLDDTGAPAPAKVVGEIAVRSSSLADGAPRDDGYFRTGDSGMLDDAGSLYVL